MRLELGLASIHRRHVPPAVAHLPGELFADAEAMLDAAPKGARLLVPQPVDLTTWIDLAARLREEQAEGANRPSRGVGA